MWTTPALETRADRFVAELGGRPALDTRSLPGAFEPLVRTLLPTGPRPRLATGVTVARALRAVGRRAATVGRTLHLAAPPVASPSGRETVAHELVHVAQQARAVTPAAPPGARFERRRTVRPAGAFPSRRAVVQFFGGDSAAGGADPLEAEAADIGRRARRWRSAPLAPGPLARPVVSRPAMPPAAAAAPAPPVASWRLPGVPGADGVAAASPPVAGSAAATGTTAVSGTTDAGTAPATAPAGGTPSATGGRDASVADPALVEKLAEALEDRLLEEIERRGGRYVGVF